MSRKSIAWILEYTSKLPNDEEKIKCLQANDNEAIRVILQYCFHPSAVWALPPGIPPYKVCEYPNVENMLYSEVRRLYLFLEGGNPDLKPLRREKMFIDMLESVSPEDARLLVSIKDKVLPYDGITAEIVQKAYPGIF